MNSISKIILGFVVIAAFACVWYLLTRKSGGGGGCCGDCSRCRSDCGDRDGAPSDRQ